MTKEDLGKAWKNHWKQTWKQTRKKTEKDLVKTWKKTWKNPGKRLEKPGRDLEQYLKTVLERLEKSLKKT